MVKIFKKISQLPPNARIIETVESALRELSVIRHPNLKSASIKEIDDKAASFYKNKGAIKTLYIYYPERNVAVHTVSEKIYFELRTARNKNLITKKEQENYRNMSVGIIGMSVGFNVVSSLVFSGGPKFLRIADYDNIEISNLNRMRAPIFKVGSNKAIFAAEQIWEIDPFAKIDIWDRGVKENDLEKFITKNPKLNIFIDEMDDLALKLKSRIVCRKHRIPVIMATDNGDNVIVDVERFDKEPRRKILHGLVEDVNIESLSGISYKEWVKIATKIVNPKNFTPRLRASIRSIGKTIAAVPQLGSTATIAGSSAAYVARKIANGQKMPSGRYFINIDEIIC